jgi:hypothetical protein
VIIPTGAELRRAKALPFFFILSVSLGRLDVRESTYDFSASQGKLGMEIMLGRKITIV